MAAPVVRVSVQALRDDFEQVFAGLAERGDAVWVEAGKQRFLLVNGAEQVHEVLVARSADLVKPRSQAIDTGPARAEPPLDFDLGTVRREVTGDLAGADSAAAAIAAAALETATWVDGSTVELMPALRRIAIRTYSPGIDDADVERLDRVLRWLDDAPRVLPASRFGKYSLQRAAMQRELSLVVEHIGSDSPVAGDLVLGGTGPVAQTAGWLLFRFASLPEEAARLRAEWPATERTEAFVREVTRLHPTNPRITRTAVVDTEVAGESVPAATRVVLNVNAISRSARFYDEPDRLLPDRWLGGRPDKFAYLSFGIGERRCLGETFALSALTALLPALSSGRRLELVGAETTATGRRQLAEGTRALVSVC
ncbi:MAG TPA: cytochrome P450 [Gaiellaceae bacterium]|jgi:cytochrome P450